MRSPRTSTMSSPRLLQLEKASTAAKTQRSQKYINKYIFKKLEKKSWKGYSHIYICISTYIPTYLPPYLYTFLSSVYLFWIRIQTAERIFKTIAMVVHFLTFSFVVGILCLQKNGQYLVNFNTAEFCSWILGGQSIRECYFMVSFSCNPSGKLFCGK